jgi:hypothetical protein
MTDMNNSTPPSENPVIFHILPDSLEPYVAAGKTLIPLHAWHSKSEIGGTVRADGKRPRDKNWTVRPYDPQEVLDECVMNNWNVGVRLELDDLVLDVDPRNDGDKSFQRFCAGLGLDPADWPRSLTGGGGDHYYLKKPADLRVRGSLEDYPGLEFKTFGQQVVAAGSVHPDTKKRYRWAPEHPPLGDAPDAPAKLLGAICRPEPSGEAAKGGEYEPEQIAAMLKWLKPEDFREYKKWLALMMAVHHASGGAAREEFIAWSTSDPDYSDHDDSIGEKWDRLDPVKKGGVTFGTLRHYLHEAGASHAIPPDSNAAADFDDEPLQLGDVDQAGSEIALVENRGLKVNPKTSKAEDTYTNAVYAVMNSGLLPGFNELSQTVEFGNIPWHASSGRTFNDHTLRIVRLFLSNKFQGNAYEPGEKHVFDAVMAVAYSKKFNPVLDYIAGLTWDGVPRLDRLFIDYIPCGDSPYTRAVSTCFGIGAVRRMRQPGCKLDTMPVVKGPQGWGKSTGVQALFGPKWFSDADMGSLKDKDAAMKLRGVWGVEFAEIDSLNKAATGDLKAFMSRATDRQRDPYGRIVEEHPRRCVFVATVNEGGYLKDSTGARRFWPLELDDRVDVTRIEADRDQLWAEAAAREAAGESHVLPQALWSVAAEEQARQTTDDPWSDALRAFLEARARDWDAGEFEHHDDPTDVPRPPDRVHSGRGLSRWRQAHV